MTVLPFGERALLVELGDRIDPGLAERAHAIADAWEALGHGPAVPAYASVLLTFDPLRLAPERAEVLAGEIAGSSLPRAGGPPAPRTIVIPTVYDGPDLADVAARSALTPDEIVELHTARTYRAFFLGFLPGYAYCGTLDPRIVAPRLAEPRVRLPAGSVGVAAGQTAVYPFESPGGWRLIGRTAQSLWDPAADPPARIRAGDLVRFVRVA